MFGSQTTLDVLTFPNIANFYSATCTLIFLFYQKVRHFCRDKNVWEGKHICRNEKREPNIYLTQLEHSVHSLLARQHMRSVKWRKKVAGSPKVDFSVLVHTVLGGSGSEISGTHNHTHWSTQYWRDRKISGYVWFVRLCLRSASAAQA